MNDKMLLVWKILANSGITALRSDKMKPDAALQLLLKDLTGLYSVIKIKKS